MKRYEEMAFDWADENCPCPQDEDIDCEAMTLQKGFEAGFKAAREMAVRAFQDSREKYRYWRFDDAFAAMERDLATLGEEEGT